MFCFLMTGARNRTAFSERGAALHATPMHLVDWSPFIAAESDAAAVDAAGVGQCWGRAKRKWDVSRGQAGDAAPAGDARMEAVERCLDAFEGFPRSNAQRRFHTAFMQATLPHVYGTTDFEKYRDRILARHGMKKVQYECLVCTPRRFGKTTAVAMYCAALLANCDDMWISVFSTGQRASSSLLEQTAKFLRMLPNQVLDAICGAPRHRVDHRQRQGRTTAAARLLRGVVWSVAAPARGAGSRTSRHTERGQHTPHDIPPKHGGGGAIFHLCRAAF